MSILMLLWKQVSNNNCIALHLFGWSNALHWSDGEQQCSRWWHENIRACFIPSCLSGGAMLFALVLCTLVAWRFYDVMLSPIVAVWLDVNAGLGIAILVLSTCMGVPAFSSWARYYSRRKRCGSRADNRWRVALWIFLSVMMYFLKCWQV